MLLYLLFLTFITQYNFVLERKGNKKIPNYEIYNNINVNFLYAYLQNIENIIIFAARYMKMERMKTILNTKYILVLGTLLFAIQNMSWSQNQGKMSAYVRKAVAEYQSCQKAKDTRLKAKKVHVPEMTALVKTSDVQLLKQNGCKIYANWDDIYIASIPLDNISSLCSHPSIHRIEAGKSCSITNDNSAEIVRAKDVWNSPAPLSATGKGVIVGVMDIGFDFTHPNWYSTDTQEYRIKQVWDMLDYSEEGEPVVGKSSQGADTIYVGRQYIGEDAILNKRHSADGLTQSHGTHTMGTATGSGYEGNGTISPYIGMAPDVEMCVVANYTTNNKDVVPEDDQYKYTMATDLLGFKYIFDYAESVGKPCVINLSEGEHLNLNDDILYHEVINKMVGAGRIICASAGNDGGYGTYIHKAKGESKKGAFLFSNSSDAAYVMRSKKPVKMQVSFYQDEQKIKTWEYDTKILSAFPDSVMEDTIQIGDSRFPVSLCVYPDCYDNTLYATEFQITDTNNDMGVFGMNTAMSLTVLGVDNDIEVFSAGGIFYNNALDNSLRDFELSHSVLFPGCAERVIGVGATAHITEVPLHYGGVSGDNFGTDGIRATFSGVGPTIDNRIKPDVMAPGVNIVSSINSYKKDLHLEEKYGSRWFEYEGRKHYWALSKGTSMSCPIVTGVIALWLQVCPTLTPEQIKDVFAHTCTHFDLSLSYPNNYYGWGEIDALAGIQYINSVYTGIEDIINDSNDKTIYDINGMKINDIKRRGFYIVSDGKSRKKVLVTK